MDNPKTRKNGLKKMNRGLFNQHFKHDLTKVKRSYERNDRKTRRSRESRGSRGSRERKSIGSYEIIQRNSRDNTLDLDIIYLCNSILKNVKDTQKIPHLEILDEELIKYDLAFTRLKYLKLSSVDKLKNFIKIMKIKKVVHYDHYRNHPTPIISILSVYLQEVILLLDVITQYNVINIPYDDPGLTNWKEDIYETYRTICREFSLQLPCMEGYIDKLGTLLNTMRTPPRPHENITHKVLLSIDDFTNDGDFFNLTDNIFDKWQIIQLSIVAFKNVLCGTRNSCTENFEEVRQSYNIDNYYLFLEYIDFYNRFAHLNITPEDVEMVSIDVVDPSAVPLNKICCKKEFVTNMGGKRK